MRSIIYLLLFFFLVDQPSSLLRADGGSICVSQRKGKYAITVFSAPTPFRAGPVDISVLVLDPATGEPIADAEVTIRVVQREVSGMDVRYRATTEAATNKLCHAANFSLPAPGRYWLEASVNGALGVEQVHFDLEAADPLPPWLTIMPWVAWPFLVILLLGIHQVLVSRRAANRVAQFAQIARHMKAKSAQS